jgi:cysteine desulfurase / selenocysteine lyase
MPPRSVVISTGLEHHSNDLPWRNRARVIRANVTREGRLDENHLDELLRTYRDRVALLTVSGASNVTGFVQPIHRLARKAHGAGARIFVDAAQLAPHHSIDVKPIDDPEHIDFIAFSAHKMYAPFGTGALVGHRDVFLHGAPDYQGGGTVETVTPTEVRWAGLPDREEAGTPNVVGAIAMAAAARALMSGGLDDLARHEAELTAYALDQLRTVRGLTVYGETRMRPDRIGVIAFNLDGLHHALVAAILGYEGGIGVRNGCFCAQSYVAHLLRGQTDSWDEASLAGDRTKRPGMVRISFGAYNTADDVDAAVDMLTRISKHDYRGHYYQVQESGDFRPAAYDDAIHKYFSMRSNS